MKTIKLNEAQLRKLILSEMGMEPQRPSTDNMITSEDVELVLDDVNDDIHDLANGIAASVGDRDPSVILGFETAILDAVKKVLTEYFA